MPADMNRPIGESSKKFVRTRRWLSTPLEKSLTVVGAIMLLTIIALTCRLAQSQADNGENAVGQNEIVSAVCAINETMKSIPLCLTEECVRTANYILSSMDSSRDPCQDFYSFACGAYEKKHIPEDKTSIGAFSNIHDELEEKMIKLLETNVTENDTFANKLAKNLYISCMNEEKVEKLGFSPLRDVLQNMGGWPVLEGDLWNESLFSWEQATFNNRRLGFSLDLIVDFSISIDLKNSSWRMISFDETSLGLSRNYLKKDFNDKTIQAYWDYMVGVAKLLGANESYAREQLKSSLLFEMNIANLTMAVEDRRNVTKTYNLMKLSDVSQLMPGVDFVNYTNELLKSAKQQVSPHESVTVTNPDFMRNLSTLIQDTPKRVVANYMMWRVVASTVPYLHQEVRDVAQKFSTELTGRKKQLPRWRKCLSGAMSSFGIPAGSLYVKHYFDAYSRNSALKMIKRIHNEFDHILEGIDWMDDQTKEKAKEKSKAIKYRVGYPEPLLNDTAVNEIYEGLAMEPDNYFGNGVKYALFQTDYGFKKLREKYDKDDWKNDASAAVVNAFYSPIRNAIIFPAGILQGVFYGSRRPDYLNYGSIGYVIGHEITHGFDDSGRKFNGKGDLQEWWENNTKENFLQRAKCMIEQYGNITYSSINTKINGKLTQGENIADNGGLKQARLAYQRMMTGLNREPSLPGLHQFTNEQMFWLSAASTWCSATRPATLKKRLLSDSHSPARERVNVPLSNLDQFASDWRCAKGSNMNPGHKCAVW